MMVSIYENFVYCGGLHLKSWNRNLSLGKAIWNSFVINLVMVLDATCFRRQTGQKLITTVK